MQIRECYDSVRSYTFHNGLFVPSYSVSLMSAISAVAGGSSFNFATDASHLQAPDGGQLPVKHRGKFSLLECKFKRNPLTLVKKTRRDTSKAMLWYRRLGHLNQ